MATATLRKYLTRKNEDLRVNPPKNTKSTDSTTKGRYANPQRIIPWREFTKGNLDLIFDGQIQRFLDEVPQKSLPNFSSGHEETFIGDHESLTTYLQAVNQKVINESLNKTPQPLNGHRVQMLGEREGSLLYNEPGHTLRPDWGGVNDQSSDEQIDRSTHNTYSLDKAIIIAGDTKCAWHWKSSDLPSILNKDGTIKKGNSKRLWPIRQLVQYCINSHARYGYIISNFEVVALRITVSEDSDMPITTELTHAELRKLVRDHPVVEYVSIPWTAAGSDSLTVNLTLYHLHLLAANSGKLARTPYHMLLPLAEEKLLDPATVSQRAPHEESFGTSDPPVVPQLTGSQQKRSREERAARRGASRNGNTIRSADTSFASTASFTSIVSTTSKGKKRARSAAAENEEDDTAKKVARLLSPGQT